MNKKINELIEYYITLRREDPANENEVYKWQAIEHFEQHWDIDASDFYKMFKESFKKRENLVYQNSFSFLDALGKHFPEQLRNLFIIVYSSDDFYTKLEKAENFAQNNIEELRKVLNKTNFNHQFDERTLSFLLTMQNPNEETFYKSTLYIQLCKYLGITPQKEGKYKHYIALLFQIIPFLNDPKFNSLKMQFVPQGEDFPLLLAQDIVYQNLNREKDMINENISNEDSIIELLKCKPQIILQGPPGTGKTREAKRIAKSLLGLGENDTLESNEQFKLIQFHPSYSYEDFVRGIIAENTDDNISYVTKDKILTEFAKKALEDPYELIKWEDFRDYLIKEREKNENVFFDKKEIIKFDSIKKYDDGEAIYVQCLENNKWKVGENGLNLPKNFTNENLYDNFVTFKENQKKKDGYWSDIVDYFIDWAKKFKKKPYVLVIDEINRANLSAVLGELIYALEYRGEAVQSMYAIDGENNLILPPNLYIIGTMNTADRSVGHIDYAIRRRFAFVNILPKDLTNELGDQFEGALFAKVTNLFNTNLSSEFKKEEVQLGHSYFITKNTPINIRWEYEIKPILFEYVKDGILVGEGIETTINNLINNENYAS